jgi:hypothetical protein
MAEIQHIQRVLLHDRTSTTTQDTSEAGGGCMTHNHGRDTTYSENIINIRDPGDMISGRQGSRRYDIVNVRDPGDMILGRQGPSFPMPED